MSAVARLLLLGGLVFTPLGAEGTLRAGKGMVVSQEQLASDVGAAVLAEGGHAVDAAVATAFALAVVLPAAGNLGGGGFMLLRTADGKNTFLDFRETAPAAAHPRMWLRDGAYDKTRHHESHLSVGVPGTVAGLHAAWKAHGRLSWGRLLQPAIRLARDGFVLTGSQAASLEKALPEFRKHPASLAQFSRQGEPYRAGDRLAQPDLARTLERLARKGPADFYAGETARLLVREMKVHGGLLTQQDLRDYRPLWREPLLGTYRGLQVIAAPPPSSGGVVLLEALNLLEGIDLQSTGPGSPDTVHFAAEAMRRAYADRARYLGDPAFAPDMPVARLISKEYAAVLRATLDPDRASVSAPSRFEWSKDRPETTQVSVVDQDRVAVSLTYTLEDSYGSKVVVPGAGFLLNNELGDFNAGPGLTDASGLIGTDPNLARPHQRPLSSMCPVILLRDGKLFMVAGSPGGRTIPNTVLEIILNVVDFRMDARAAVDAQRFHHQWLPDWIQMEPGFPRATLEALKARGHALKPVARQGVAQVILVKDGILEGAADTKRWADSGAAGH